jgi:hypothetical protein
MDAIEHNVFVAMWQILELCRGGELFDRIVEQGTFTERSAAGAVAPLEAWRSEILYLSVSRPRYFHNQGIESGAVTCFDRAFPHNGACG